MASSSLSKTSEETFEYICTACANDDLIKEALKYCVECQQYCCKDCLTSHRRISSLQGHSFLDNSSVKSQGQPRTLPAFPTKQCSKHVGKILDMYCENHDVVCCYACAAEDHKSCKDIVSVSDNIDRLYNMTDTTKATSELNDTIDTMTQLQTDTDTRLHQLQESKVTAIKAVSDFRIEMEKFLKKLKEVSIKEIEEEYKKLEAEILEERKRYEDFIDDLKTLKQLFSQASRNIAQQFVCSKLSENKCTSIRYQQNRESLNFAEVKFTPSDDLKSSIEKMVHLGEASAISSKTYNVYKATKICDMMVGMKEDKFPDNWTLGSCIVDDTVIFTDYLHNKLKRFDISSSSLVDSCEVPEGPRGICTVGYKEVAVACNHKVQFVSVHDKLTLMRCIKMDHWCYGLAHSNNKLYITDEYMSLYLHDMSGNLLKTVTNSDDDGRQPLFKSSNHITVNDKSGRVFVGDSKKGLVCFNAQCDYIETITDPDVRPNGVCVDGYGNVIIANSRINTIVQCGRDGQKHSIIVNKNIEAPQCVCVHYDLRKMFVGYESSNTVEVYNLTWKQARLDIA
ncbi:hypothetical protein ACF0H5_024512 [Mactra antiquata]